MYIWISLVLGLVMLAGAAKADDHFATLKRWETLEARLGGLAGRSSAQDSCSDRSQPGFSSAQKGTCEDLFDSACSGTGSTPANEKVQTPDQLLAQRLARAKDQAAKQMGYADFDTAIQEKLRENGLPVRSDVDPVIWSQLKKGNGFSKEDAPKLFVPAQKCAAELDELQKTSDQPSVDLNQLAQRRQEFYKRQQAAAVPFLAKDIPNFLEESLGAKCLFSESEKDQYTADEMRQVVQTCQKMRQIRAQAVELFRQEGTPEYTGKAEQFVRQYLLPEGAGALDQSCMFLYRAMRNAGDKVLDDLRSQVVRSKPVVESIIGEYYSDKKKAVAQTAFQQARDGINSMVQKITKDPVKRIQIIKSTSNLKLHWMVPLPESAYKSENGLLVFEEKQDGLGPPSGSKAGDVLTVFSDPRLSFFSMENASYTPAWSLGEQKHAGQVMVLPALLEKLEQNPHATLLLVAHEQGHQLGLQVGKINGYDLSPEFQPLLDCYKSSQSIRMQAAQTEEVIADHFAAEVLARQLEKIPQSQRHFALLSAMQPFCAMEANLDKQYTVACHGVHPDPLLRINGIFGANAAIRQGLGCVGPSPRYQSCSVTGGSP